MTADQRHKVAQEAFQRVRAHRLLLGLAEEGELNVSVMSPAVEYVLYDCGRIGDRVTAFYDIVEAREWLRKAQARRGYRDLTQMYAVMLGITMIAKTPGIAEMIRQMSAAFQESVRGTTDQTPS